MSKHLRVCFLGDSLVNGLGDPRCLGWPGRACAVAAEAGVSLTYYNLGVRAATSQDVRERLTREVPARLVPAAEGRLAVSFGMADAVIEDGRPRLSIEASVDNLWDIVSTAGRRWPLLVVGPPPAADPALDARVARLAEAFEAACRGMDAPYLDMRGALLRDQGYLEDLARGDGIHPGAAGYDLMAEAFMGWDAWLDWLEP